MRALDSLAGAEVGEEEEYDAFGEDLGDGLEGVRVLLSLSAVLGLA